MSINSPVARELLVRMLPWLKPEENTVNVCLLHFYFLKLFNIASHPNFARTVLIGKGLTEGQISYYTSGGGNQQETFSRAMQKYRMFPSIHSRASVSVNSNNSNIF